jgi:hypothetical protein
MGVPPAKLHERPRSGGRAQGTDQTGSEFSGAVCRKFRCQPGLSPCRQYGIPQPWLGFSTLSGWAFRPRNFMKNCTWDAQWWADPLVLGAPLGTTPPSACFLRKLSRHVGFSTLFVLRNTAVCRPTPVERPFKLPCPRPQGIFPGFPSPD